MTTEPTESPKPESLELPVAELLHRGRPLPPHEEMEIENLREEDALAFFEAVNS